MSVLEVIAYVDENHKGHFDLPDHINCGNKVKINIIIDDDIEYPEEDNLKQVLERLSKTDNIGTITAKEMIDNIRLIRQDRMF